MQFLYQPLTWGFLLVLLPVLIHLINLMRHKRVKWAAMDFLLRAHKKHRRWIWLKQLLLLLMRMAAIAAAVAMLAHLVTRNEWSSFFGGKVTHHYVLLDDSLSMSDRSGSSEAFDRAKQVLSRIVDRAATADTTQQMTLVRFSNVNRVANATTETAQSTPMADLVAEVIDDGFDEQLEARRRAFRVTELALDPAAALEAIQSLIGEDDEENRVLYVISDFRQGTWKDENALKEKLRDLQNRGVELHFVRCVQQARENLAIVDLMPAEGVRAAGVPLFVDVKVKNFGTQPANQVQIKVRTRFVREIGSDGHSDEQVDELPSLLIDRIGAGETITRQAQVFFPIAGQHMVEAVLPHDAVAADNSRYCVVDMQAAVPVLVIDGDPEERNAYYLSSVFDPGERTTTGILPDRQLATYLRDVEAEALNKYEAIYLANVPRLDERAVANLRRYVREGGGVAFYLGPDANLGFYNQLHEDGAGLFPAPLFRVQNLEMSDGPDILVADHPIFSVLKGQRNPFAAGIRIGTYVAVKRGWTPPEESTIGILAETRGGEPLVLERRFGEGRVVAFLTTLGPAWTNWALEPSFIVVALQLHTHLASPRRDEIVKLAGTPVDLQLDAAVYKAEVDFVVPNRNGTVTTNIKTIAKAPQEDSPLLNASLGSGPEDGLRTGETDYSGVYEARLRRIQDMGIDARRFALNVDTTESDLALMETSLLLERLQPLEIEVHDVDQLAYQGIQQAGFSWSQILLFGLIALLVLEQLLAYSCSYHPARGGGVAA